MLSEITSTFEFFATNDAFEKRLLRVKTFDVLIPEIKPFKLKLYQKKLESFITNKNVHKEI